jgi:superfamily II DNA or RNA helicase
MNYDELIQKYNDLLIENQQLKKELAKYKDSAQNLPIPSNQEVSIHSVNIANSINQYSSTSEKIALYRSLFQGRTDVYAKRWQNREGKTGYSPGCLNEWKSDICIKPKGKCSDCSNKAYQAVTDNVISDHLTGKLVVGIYPMLLDETCLFLAIDFDENDWTKDVTIISEICKDLNIPIVIERSRSGNGAHAWFFFTEPIPAIQARRFGTAILTNAMSKRHEISFNSYDRLFPNQDTMPKGRLGNLIALPLQKTARQENNTEFIDETFTAYKDQWAFLANITILTPEDVNRFTNSLNAGCELGSLSFDEECSSKPWEKVKHSKLTKDDFSSVMSIVKSNMLFIDKNGLSQKALNQIKRLAAFKNPEFYKAQAMRLPTFNKPRVISCCEETDEYLCLPRGCQDSLISLLSEYYVRYEIIDRANHGTEIDVNFNGQLRDEQQIAFNSLTANDNGILCGTTAFGKTIVAIRLIAERKVNTLILVDRVSLVSQWKIKLLEFLTINHVPKPTDNKQKGKNSSIIGQVGAGKNAAIGIIDIALFQTLNRSGDINEIVKNYGMIIVDECHHVSAISFEQVLKSAKAKYVFGLSATPVRKDGHHPIIFMQCGEIRYRDDAKKQAENRPFEHYIIPRFSSMMNLNHFTRDITINDLYAAITTDIYRNQIIIDDIVAANKAGRNCCILTERTAHIDLLAEKLRPQIPDLIILTGKLGTKDLKKSLDNLTNAPSDKPITLIATGKFIGEGFDEPRLDTLFLTMPISWKGTLQQYAGRLHRLFATKKEVQIYDYIDVHVPMLEKMYHKRLNGYASIGYKIKKPSLSQDSINIIFDNKSFQPVYINDIANASKEIIIVSPFVRKHRVLHILQHFLNVLSNDIKITVLTL